MHLWRVRKRTKCQTGNLINIDQFLRGQRRPRRNVCSSKQKRGRNRANLPQLREGQNWYACQACRNGASDDCTDCGPSGGSLIKTLLPECPFVSLAVAQTCSLAAPRLMDALFNCGRCRCLRFAHGHHCYRTGQTFRERLS